MLTYPKEIVEEAWRNAHPYGGKMPDVEEFDFHSNDDLAADKWDKGLLKRLKKLTCNSRQVRVSSFGYLDVVILI